ncbi:MAG: hypothetical protein EA396_01075 [Anaerolineaceae bacterium]|nr:MAG: hypothetical protein EA396_01075 [Anaerolineaceae bacterium]
MKHKAVGLLSLVLLMLWSILPVAAQVEDATTISYGDTVRGTLAESEGKSSIYYTFFGEAGDAVIITMIADDTSTLDPYLYLYEADGETELIRNDDAAGGTLGLNSQIDRFVLPATDQYVIRASHWGTRGNGDFALTLELAQPLEPIDPSSDARVVGTLNYGDSVRGEITDGQDEQLYAFEAQAGDTVTITMIADDMNQLDTYLYLYDAIGIELARNDDALDSSIGRLNSQIVGYVIPQDGTYLIGASRWGSLGTGGYTLSLETAEHRADVTPTGDFVRFGYNGIDVEIPSDWVTLNTGESVFFATSAAARDIMVNNQIERIPPDGDLGMSFIVLSPMLQASIGLPDLPLDQMMPELLELLELNASIEPFDDGNVQIMFAFVLPSDGELRNTVVMLTEYPDGFVLWSARYGGDDPFSDYSDVIIDIVSTKQYQGESVFDLPVLAPPLEPPPLPEGDTIGVDGFSVGVPEGWAADVMFDLGYIASNQATLELVRDEFMGVPASGQVGVSFWPLSFDVLQMEGLTSDNPADLLNEFTVLSGLTGVQDTFDLVDFPAAIYFADAGEDVPENAVLLATEFPNGFVLWAVQYGRGDAFDDYADIVADILSGVLYEGVPLYGDSVAVVIEEEEEEAAGSGRTGFVPRPPETTATTDTAFSDFVVGESGMQAPVPDGWMADTQGEEILLATDSATLSILRDADGFGTLVDGEVGVTIFVIDEEFAMFMDYDVNDPVLTLTAFAALLESAGDVMAYEVSDSISAALTIIDGGFAPQDAALIAASIDGVLIAFAVQFGPNDDFSSHDALVRDIIGATIP